MTPITIEDLTPLDEYARSYREARKRIIQVKAPRRVVVGASIAFLFENRETLLYQIQEMLRVEHITAPDKIQYELDVYNALLPAPGELSATMFIQITDQQHLKEHLDMLKGIDGDNITTLRLGAMRIVGVFEAGHSKDDKISAVHFVRFRLPAEAIMILSDPKHAAVLRIDHPNYNASTPLSTQTRNALLSDLQ